MKNKFIFKLSDVLLMILFSFFNSMHSQTIKGRFDLLRGSEIKLEGFTGLKSYQISTSKIDSNGYFSVNYTKKDYGVGYLISSEEKPLFIILSGEDVEVVGESLSYFETIRILKGKDNLRFEQYSKEYSKREQALSAWIYLEKMYKMDSLFSTQKTPAKAILKEKSRIKKEDVSFLNALPNESYLKWFLPIRKLVSSVSLVAQYRTEEIPSTIAAFRTLDYSDNRLYKSGLLKDAIESHFWLLENSGKSLDSVFMEMQLSIDAMLNVLVKDGKILNEVSVYLFDLLERHSLFQASEYLAIKLLNQSSCTINSDLTKQLETYRAMKKGNIAPNIIFPQTTIYPNNEFKPSKLSDIQSPYTLVVFGASWCPKCKQEIPEIANNYFHWKSMGLEVLFVSLDEKENDFIGFVSELPFVSVCDFQKWKSQIAQDYYVFGTPTMYLLDQNQKIILRPNSIKQMEAWVDWFLVKGNTLPNN